MAVRTPLCLLAPIPVKRRVSLAGRFRSISRGGKIQPLRLNVRRRTRRWKYHLETGWGAYHCRGNRLRGCPFPVSRAAASIGIHSRTSLRTEPLQPALRRREQSEMIRALILNRTIRRSRRRRFSRAERCRETPSMKSWRFCARTTPGRTGLILRQRATSRCRKMALP